MVMVSADNAPEVVLCGWIGDRVRDGEDNARELELTLAACNRWFEWEDRPFDYVRRGEDVFLEARFSRADVTEEELRLLVWEFERELDCVPEVLEAHMEPLHDGEDEDCVCPPCADRSRGATTPEELQSYLGARQEWADLGLSLDPLAELAWLG